MTRTPPPRGGRHRLATVVLSLTLALAVTLVLGVALGPTVIPLDDAVRYVHAALTGGTVTADEVSGHHIVWRVRAPRVLLAMLAGAGLSLVGIAVQAMVRNALADPLLLGVSSGASTGAAAVVVFGLIAGLGAYVISSAALLGASGTAVLLFLAARGRTGLTPLRSGMTGIALAYGFQVVITLVVFVSPTPYAAGMVLFWTMGGLGAATWIWLPLAAAGALSCVLLLLRHGRVRGLGAMDVERSIGIDVATARRRMFVLTSAVTGLLVAVSGVVGLVSLVMPYLARMLVGGANRHVLAVAPLAGSCFMIWADVAARTFSTPPEVPLGVVVALVGVPVFVTLLNRVAGASSASGHVVRTRPAGSAYPRQCTGS